MLLLNKKNKIISFMCGKRSHKLYSKNVVVSAKFGKLGGGAKILLWGVQGGLRSGPKTPEKNVGFL